MISKTCKGCDTEFTREQINRTLARNIDSIGWQRRKFCSVKCQRSFNSAKGGKSETFGFGVNPLPPIHRTWAGKGKEFRKRDCDICGSEYTYERDDSRFCGRQCYLKFYYKT